MSHKNANYIYIHSNDDIYEVSYCNTVDQIIKEINVYYKEDQIEFEDNESLVVVKSDGDHIAIIIGLNECGIAVLTKYFEKQYNKMLFDEENTSINNTECNNCGGENCQDECQNANYDY